MLVEGYLLAGVILELFEKLSPREQPVDTTTFHWGKVKSSAHRRTMPIVCQTCIWVAVHVSASTFLQVGWAAMHNLLDR